MRQRTDGILDAIHYYGEGDLLPCEMWDGPWEMWDRLQWRKVLTLSDYLLIAIQCPAWVHFWVQTCHMQHDDILQCKCSKLSTAQHSTNKL